jgi:hypothetical protein
MNELTQAEDMVSASQSSNGMALPMPNKEESGLSGGSA